MGRSGERKGKGVGDAKGVKCGGDIKRLSAHNRRCTRKLEFEFR